MLSLQSVLQFFLFYSLNYNEKVTNENYNEKEFEFESK